MDDTWDDDKYFLALICYSKSQALKEGENVYALSSKWLFRLNEAILRGNHGFGLRINNSILLRNGMLKPNLVMPEDMILVTKDVWRDLIDHYGGGPPIEIPVVKDPYHNRIVPVYPSFYVVVWYKGDVKRIITSDLQTIGAVRLSACRLFNVYESKDVTRFRTLWGTRPGPVLPDDRTIRQLDLYNGQELILEKFKLGLQTKGLYGFQNLEGAFVCYRNSVMQCLLHSKRLCDFFINRKDDEDAVAGLFQCYWGDGSGREGLIQKVSKLTNEDRFCQSGTQQDAHEFLSVLIRRIEKYLVGRGLPLPQRKDPLEFKEKGERSDLAKKTWNEDRTKREYCSPLFDTLHGLGSDRFTCLLCGGEREQFTLSGESITLSLGDARFVYLVPYGDRKRVKVPLGLCRSPDLHQIVCAALDKEIPARNFSRNFVFAQENLEMRGIRIVAPQTIAVCDFLAFEVKDTSKLHFLVVANFEGGPGPLLVAVEDGESDPQKKICARVKDYMPELADSDALYVSLNIEDLWNERSRHGSYDFLYRDIVYVMCVEGGDKNRQIVRESFDEVRNWDITDLINGMLSYGYVSERYCEDCKRSTRAWKLQTLWVVPEVLIVQIARFSEGRKINQLVEYPLFLDMENFVQCKQAGKYRLFGVVYHLGGSIHEGHFIVDILYDAKWYSISDSFITPRMDERPMSDAYVLFYEKVQGEEDC
jgi:ubiquitin C-terminal hydrolase